MSENTDGYEPDPFKRLRLAAGLLQVMATEASEKGHHVRLTVAQCRTLARVMFDACWEEMLGSVIAAELTTEGGVGLFTNLPRHQWDALLRDAKEAHARGEDIAPVLDTWVSTRELDRDAPLSEEERREILAAITAVLWADARGVLTDGGVS